METKTGQKFTDPINKTSNMVLLGEFADRVMLRIISDATDATSTNIGKSTLAELRARQLNAIVALTPVMASANVVNSTAILLVFQFSASLSFGMIIWWLLNVLVSGYFFFKSKSAIKQKIDKLYSPRGAGLIVRNALLYGIIWTYPLVGFPIDAGNDITGAILALTGIMIAGGSIGLYPIPLAAFAFTGVLTFVGTISIILSNPGHIVSWAAMSMAFIAVVYKAIHHHSKVFLGELVALLQMAEKRSVSGLLLQQYEENSDNWIWECNADWILTSGTEIFAKRLVVDPIALTQKKFTAFLNSSPKTNSRADIQMLEIALTSQVPVSGLVVDHWNGHDQQFWKIHALPQHDHEGIFTGYLGFAIDVTREEAASKRIEYLATRDAQTGLLNKSEFLHRLTSQINHLKQSTPDGWLVSLAFMDSDGLKAVNDTFGHAAGDAMIMEISTRLTNFTDSSSLIGRIGGDEFLVAEFHKKSLPSQIVTHQVWLTSLLAEPFQFQELEIKMSVSCGLSISAISVADIDRLMQQADRALYHIKQHGGAGCLLYEDRIGHPIARRRELSMDIARAIREKEITVHFQPIVNTHDFSITGYEALARWTRRDGTRVSPEDFVTAAEESGQIVVLGAFVLEQAISTAVNWKNPVRLSINVSVFQLQYSGFVEELVEFMEKYKFSSDRLLLEIVENILLQTNAVVQENLLRIKELGIVVAFDDFGKGYSSFA